MSIDLTTNKGYKASFIYRIECNGKVYIGQTTQGYDRLRAHLMGAYKNVTLEPIYNDIRKVGIANTHIYLYEQGADSSHPYGLPREVYNTFFSLFKPNKGLDKDGNPQIDLNVAEVLHILLATYQGKLKVTNTSMGGYRGVSYTAAQKGKNSNIKVLTQATTPSDALRLINMETKDLVDLAELNRDISKVAFGDN